MDKRLVAIVILFFLIIKWPVYAQEKQKLTLDKAIELVIKNNLNIQKATLKKQLYEEESKEKKEQYIPEVGFHGSYARITNLTEFKNGLTDKQITHTIPEWADATVSATIPLYSGNMIRNSIKKAELEDQWALLDIQKTKNDVQIDVIANFLGIYKLMKLQQLLAENCKEEKDRLREVRSFKKHGTVTNNEVLRNELQLSDRELQLLSNKRRISLAIHNLITLIKWPEQDSLEIDTLHLLDHPFVVKNYQHYLNAALQKEEVEMAHRQEAIRKTESQIVKGNFYPKINLFGSYGFNYPNYMFFPPNPNIYTLGKVGIEAVFSLSGLYKNATKMAIAQKNIEIEKTGTAILTDAISDNIFEKYTEYQEISDKIPVTEKAVKQAKENYRIVNLKYRNQLALVTDMIDADNALLQAQFDNVSSKIDALMKYFELQHAAGLLQLNE